MEIKKKKDAIKQQIEQCKRSIESEQEDIKRYENEIKKSKAFIEQLKRDIKYWENELKK